MNRAYIEVTRVDDYRIHIEERPALVEKKVEPNLSNKKSPLK